jgi:hypothetical protein
VSLLDYARDQYSQNGGDGIIEHIFSVVGDGPGLSRSRAGTVILRGGIGRVKAGART